MSFKLKLNWGIVLPVAFLSLFGIVMVYSASSYSASLTYSDAFYFVKKQALGVVLGGIAMLLLSKFDYKKLIKLRYIALLLGFILLLDRKSVV